MSETPLPYALDDLVKDSVPFIINSTSGDLKVSGVLEEEHYDLLILARGVEYTTRIHIEVLVNFQPMFVHRIVVTLDAGSAGIGDTVLNIPLCLDQNLESSANGNLSLHLEGNISTHFSISQEGSLKVARLLWDVSGGLYQLTVRCSDRGKPQTLGDELAILLHIAPGMHPCLFYQSHVMPVLICIDWDNIA